MLAALAVLAGVGLASVLFAVFRPSDNPEAGKPVAVTQSEIDAELGALQEALQSALQEKKDLSRLYAKARLFTERFPGEPAGHVLLAQICLGSQRWSDAYLSWTRALELDPDGYELWKMAGFTAAKLGRLEESRAQYTQAAAIQGDRTDSDVFTSIGRLELVLGNLTEAEQAFTRALDAPGIGEKTNWKHEAYAGLADVASVRGDHDKAHELVDRAIKLAKIDSSADLAGYHIQKSRLYMDAGDHEQALTMLTHTWQLYPTSPQRIESAELRATLYEYAGDLARAVNHIAYVCETYQNNPQRIDDQLADYYALLATWQLKAGQLDAATTSVHNISTLVPTHPKLAELQQKLNP